VKGRGLSRVRACLIEGFAEAAANRGTKSRSSATSTMSYIQGPVGGGEHAALTGGVTNPAINIGLSLPVPANRCHGNATPSFLQTFPSIGLAPRMWNTGFVLGTDV